MKATNKLERVFQKDLVKENKEKLKGCIIMKNDSSYIQGIPDWIILFKDKWALLEVKKSAKANKKQNKEYYVDKANTMSFARFIFPENKDEVLRDLFSFFGLGGNNDEIQ